MWKEFKEFAFKGNVMDMAIGVIIGGAFGKIVTSLVNDVMMPLIGLLIGNVNFADLRLVLKPEVRDAAMMVVEEEVSLMYGSFIQNIVDFIIIALCIFLFVKLANKLRAEKEVVEEAPKGPSSEELLVEIRDLLKKK